MPRYILASSNSEQTYVISIGRLNAIHYSLNEGKCLHSAHDQYSQFRGMHYRMMPTSLLEKNIYIYINNPENFQTLPFSIYTLHNSTKPCKKAHSHSTEIRDILK